MAMAFKLGTKAAAAASPAAAHRGGLARGPQGASRVVFGPAASRTKGLRAANNSVTPMRGALARGPQGASRVAFGPAASRTQGLRAANNSVTPMAKYETSFITNQKLFGSMNDYCCAWFSGRYVGLALDPGDFVLVRVGLVVVWYFPALVWCWMLVPSWGSCGFMCFLL